jgi:tRNA G46 methylase TrmB
VPPCTAAPKQDLNDPDNHKGTTVADHQPATGNAAQIEFWNSAATRAWADQYARMDRAVAALTKELLDFAAPQPGERVLDIGCGPGTTVLELARRVSPGGHVLGADVSEPSVARACERIATAGLRHAPAGDHEYLGNESVFEVSRRRC